METALEKRPFHYEGRSKGRGDDDVEIISVYVESTATVRRGDPRLTAVGKLLKGLTSLFSR